MYGCVCIGVCMYDCTYICVCTYGCVGTHPFDSITYMIYYVHIASPGVVYIRTFMCIACVESVCAEVKAFI